MATLADSYTRDLGKADWSYVEAHCPKAAGSLDHFASYANCESIGDLPGPPKLT